MKQMGGRVVLKESHPQTRRAASHWNGPCEHCSPGETEGCFFLERGTRPVYSICVSFSPALLSAKWGQSYPLKHGTHSLDGYNRERSYHFRELLCREPQGRWLVTELGVERIKVSVTHARPGTPVPAVTPRARVCAHTRCTCSSQSLEA